MTVKAKLVQGGDGTAIPAGFVGETKSAAATAVTASGIGGTNIICSLSLETGNWLLVAATDCYNGTRPATNSVAGGVDLYNSTDASIITSLPLLALWPSAATIGESVYYGGSIMGVISITATKTIQYRIKMTDVGGATGTPTTNSRANGKFYAVRLPG